MTGNRILVVDDTPANVKLLVDVLGAKGFVTSAAVNGEEALAKIAAAPPDLVLMDIQLPDINGIEAFERIRADPGTAAVPVVAFTASVTPTDRNRITQAGFSGFVSKPIELKQFLATVKRMVEGGA